MSIHALAGTRQLVIAQIARTTGQHTRWLRFDDRQCAWFNGSDFVCQMDRATTNAEGDGRITEWAPRHK